MNTQYFKYAVEVERTRSITQAAENLYMGQPNLSRAIKEMEDSLGFSIFERSSKGVVPTKKGAEFLVYAQNILVQMERMERLSYTEDESVQSLSVSIPRGSYISNGFISFLKTLDASKSIDINLQETNAMQSISNVLDGRHNLAIIRYRLTNENYFEDYLKDKQLCSEVLWEFERIILTSDKNPYIDGDIIHADDLSKCIEVVHGDTIVPYHQSGRRDKGVEIKKIRLYERCSQYEILANIPQSYMWTSPVPENYRKRYGLSHKFSSEPGKMYKDVIIYHKGYKFTELDKRFIDNVYTSRNEVAFN